MGLDGMIRLVLMIASPALMVAATPNTSSTWIKSGRAKCIFEGDYRKVNCVHYYKIIKHYVGNNSWDEYIHRWVNDRGRDVRYTTSDGILGISTYTIGRVFDTHRKWGAAGARAVSYSADRESLNIGVPGDDYEFRTNRF